MTDNNSNMLISLNFSRIYLFLDFHPLQRCLVLMIYDIKGLRTRLSINDKETER